MKRIFLAALTIAVSYLLIGGLWIYFSDAAVKAMTDDVVTMRWLQTWKGWGFVLVTGLLVFWMSGWALYRQRVLINRLERHAYASPLTGLPSRLAALQQIEGAIEHAAEGNRRFAVVSCDLDGFGTINEGFGHEMGDHLLRAVAQRLDGARGDKGFVAHPGADKFIFVFEGIEDQGDLDRRIELPRQMLSEPFVLPGLSDLHVSTSMGVSRYPQDSRCAEELLRYSEAALSMAKRQAPGTTVIFSPDMVLKASRRIALDSALRLALAQNQLALHFQPIYQFSDHRTLVGLEALLRWNPPDGQPISPAEFIPVAERTGLILEIGPWVIDKACDQIARWRAAGLNPVPVSVNLSTRQLESAGVSGQVMAAVQRYQLSHSQLILEVTESVLMERRHIARQLLQELREQGLRIALDDFGTGYCSLSYLRELPVDSIKIDRSFIVNLERGRSDRDLVKAMISLAEIFGLTVVAEGVETQTQQTILQKLGCNHFQGYLFGKPLPESEIRPLLAPV